MKPYHICKLSLMSAGIVADQSSASSVYVRQMRVMTSKKVFTESDAAPLDAANVLRHDNRRRYGTLLLQESIGCIATPDFEHRGNTPLRLVTQAEPCSVRSTAIDALVQAGIPETEVFVRGKPLSSARPSPRARGRSAPPPWGASRHNRRRTAVSAPKLPSGDVVIYVNANDSQARSALRTFDAAIHSTAGAR